MIMNINKQRWLDFIKDRDADYVIDCIFDFDLSRAELYDLLVEHFWIEPWDNKED